MPSIFADYVFASEPLVAACEPARGERLVARLFVGVWMKRRPTAEGQRSPSFDFCDRSGEGRVARSTAPAERMRELCFLSVGEGDAGFVQSADDRRGLKDDGLGAQARGFIRNKCRLDMRDGYVDIDAVMATHCEHTGGLVHVRSDEKSAVRGFLHSSLISGALGRKAARRASLVDDPTDEKVFPSTLSMKRLAKVIEKARANLPIALAGMKAQGARRRMRRGSSAAVRFVDGFDGFARASR